jgi:hypothetical protein
MVPGHWPRHGEWQDSDRGGPLTAAQAHPPIDPTEPMTDDEE